MNHLLYIVLKKTRVNRWIYNRRKSTCYEYVNIIFGDVTNARNLLETLRMDSKERGARSTS